MMREILATITIAAGLASAQTAVTAPQVGFMHDAADSVRPVYGIAGNFLLGDPVATGVLSAAFSGSYGLIKTGSAVIVIDRAGSIVGSSNAPDGPALLSFAPTGEPALAYLPDTTTLLAWSAGTLSVVPFDPAAIGAGAVLSIASPDSDHAALVVQRDDGLWDARILLATGEVDAQTAIPGVAAPVLMLASGELVYSDANGIVVRKPDGSERNIIAPLPASFAFEQLGDGWIQLRDLTSAQQFAIRIIENRERSYQLPEVDQ
ncbi:MAG TPA: hypothetical protein VH157_01675 [Bryobacteraceae bacterium]|nr:hypothetical protein [Bryobacteraceae bacterium]